MRFCSSPGGLQEMGMPRGVVALEAFLVLLVVEHKLSLQPVKKRCFGNDQVFFFFSSGCSCCFGSSCSPEQAVRLMLMHSPPL